MRGEATVTFALASCNSDPLAISCGDYIAKDASTQLNLAIRWRAPAAEMAGPSFKSQFLAYCPAHKDALLKDIVVRYG